MNGRVRSVDIFKAVGVICMVMSHTTLCPSELTGYYNCFYMPMFFCVSGYFYHDNKLGKFAIKKGKAFLIPYFIVGAIGLLVEYVVKSKASTILFSDALNALLLKSSSNKLPIVGAIWFLMALFWAEIFFCILKKAKSEVILGAGCIGIALLGCFWSDLLTVRPIWSIDSAMVGLGFMYIGYLVSRFKDYKVIKKVFNLPFYITILLLVINVYLAAQNVISMWKNLYNSVPLLWINAIMACVVWINIAKYIDKCKVIQVGRLAGLMSYIGENSIIFLCCNQLVLWVGKRVMKTTYGWPNTDLRRITWFAILFVFTMIGLLLISEINQFRKSLFKGSKNEIY